MFTVPDSGTALNDIQSILFQAYLNVLAAGINGTECVLMGCGATAQITPDMTVAIAKGAVLTQGVLKPVVAGNATITTADATNPRLDFIVVDSTGAKQVRAGTAAAAPKPPTPSAGDVVIAVVYVPAADTALTQNQINDLRVMRSQGPINIGHQTTAVTFNTTLAIQTYYTLTLPSGLLVAGKQVRVKMGGSYLANSGTPTFAITIAYGGTTQFSDLTAATTASANRGSWDIEFTLNASANAAQQVIGHIRFQTPGAKTVPTTGVSGDMSVVTNVNSPIVGAASVVDSTAADRALVVSWTMSVSNVADECSCLYASADLI